MRKFVFTASLLSVVLPAVVNAQPASRPNAPAAPRPTQPSLQWVTTTPVAASPAIPVTPVTPATPEVAAPTATQPVEPPTAPPAPAVQPTVIETTPPVAPVAPTTPETPVGPMAPVAPATPAAAARPAPLAWRGSLMFGTVTSTLNTFVPIQSYPTQSCTVGAVAGSDLLSGINPNPNPLCNSNERAQAYNPTVQGSIAFRPRYFLSRVWQLRAGLTLNYEFTNSDLTTTINEPRFLDPNLDLWFHGIPAFQGIKLQVAARVSFPLSPEARARTNIFTPALVAQISRPFEHVLGGDLLIVGNLTVSHPFVQYTTPETRTEFPYARPCASPTDTSCRNQLSGLFNAANILSMSVTVAQDWGWISPGMFYQSSHSFAYSSSSNSDTPTVRQGSFFAAWVDFNVNSWFTTEVGYQLLRLSVLDSDGQLGNPFWAPYQDPQVYVQAVFTLDKLYQALRGSGGAGGVIRTENRVRPSRFGLL